VRLRCGFTLVDWVVGLPLRALDGFGYTCPRYTVTLHVTGCYGVCGRLRCPHVHVACRITFGTVTFGGRCCVTVTHTRRLHTLRLRLRLPRWFVYWICDVLVYGLRAVVLLIWWVERFAGYPLRLRLRLRLRFYGYTRVTFTVAHLRARLRLRCGYVAIYVVRYVAVVAYVVVTLRCTRWRLRCCPTYVALPYSPVATVWVTHTHALRYVCWLDVATWLPVVDVHILRTHVTFAFAVTRLRWLYVYGWFGYRLPVTLLTLRYVYVCYLHTRCVRFTRLRYTVTVGLTRCVPR